MNMVLRREPRTLFPDLLDWFESPFMTLRPYLAQAIRVEDYLEGDTYVLRAELAGLDPARDIEVTVGAGYLTIKAEREDNGGGRQRSEFRYGTFSRSVSLPAMADEDQVTACYDKGILTVTVPLKNQEEPQPKRVEVTH